MPLKHCFCLSHRCHINNIFSIWLIWLLIKLNLKELYPKPSVALFPQVTGDGPQTQPPINVVTNSSPSSTTATATNPSNTPITSSGTATSSLKEGDSQPSVAGMSSGKTDPTEGGPPPHPGKHEGKPSTTCTPPFVGSSGNQSQVGQGGYGRHSTIS